MLKISGQEFQTLSKYVGDLTGIALDGSKTYLLETRLNGLVTEFGCPTYADLYMRAKKDLTKGIERKIIDAVSTNETTFFRDGSPFELLRHKILPDLIDRKTKPGKIGPLSINVWSAACSTGQELYSIAITLKELLGDLDRYRIRLFGTDISDAAVAQASKGEYNRFEIERGLTKDRLLKYFKSENDRWKIKDEIRSMAVFKRHNLMESFSGLGRFDIVLCRNVAIYFSLEDRIKLFDKIADCLEPGGYLLIGSSEFLTGISQKFEAKRYLKSVFYQLPG